MIQTRAFNGKMNLDDNPYRLPSGDYSYALNITRDAQGESQDEVVTNIIGNQIVTDTLPSGTNKVIGNYPDRVKNRLYFFTWNSLGFNRISYYDLNNNSVVVLVQDLTDTDNISVLNFNPSYRINHVDIIYRDEGDILFWTDGFNPPSKINVKTAEDGEYGVIKRSYLDVAKEPPSAPPYCVYQDDNTVTVNNLLNKQFKFKTRFVYDDFEKSVTSAQSTPPIPVNYTSPSVQSDPTKNACIFLAFQTGESNVKNIELLAAESQGANFSDYYLVKVFDKEEIGLDDNTITTFKFYNNEAYVTIPIEESIQPFDYVPQKALTQSLPNGNVLDYGAITENYDIVESDSVVTQQTGIPAIKYLDSLLVLAYQGENPAFGTGTIKIIVAGQPSPTSGVTDANTITINTLVSNTPVAITATPAPTATINDILTELLASAVLGGYAGSITGDNELTISQTNATLSTISVDTYVDFPSQNSKYAYDWSSNYAFGIVYFDDKGRTNGVVTQIECAGETQSYSETTLAISVPPATFNTLTPILPNLRLSVSHRPPLWAKYFQLVRTKNLSKSNFLYWISNGTLKDNNANTAGYRYAYISIGSLTQYIIDNKETANTLGYEFTPGDRIKFIKLYDSQGNTSQVYTDKDFEIVESISNPNVNGTVVNGQVLKILLPTTSGTFDFGTNGFSNYLIEIYTPAPNFSNQQNLYYEFGQRYIVGNPGTENAIHQGETQNQSVDLVTPALFNLYEGDSFFRWRRIPTGGKVVWVHTPTNVPFQIGVYSYYLLSTIKENTTNNIRYTAQSVTTQADPPLNSNFALIINTPSEPPTFKVNGKIKVVPSGNSNNFGIIAYARRSSDNSFVNTLIREIPSPNEGVEINDTFETTYTPPTGYDQVTWSLFGFFGDLRELEITVTDSRTIDQGIIDPNFTDNYVSTASPDGRAWKIEPDAKQTFNPTLIRFSRDYQEGFAVNNTNRFYETNRDIYDRSRGTIKKMFIEGRNQYIYQEFDVGVVTILTQIVRDTSGNPLSAESDRLLNKIVYPYIGQYGIGDVPESFAYGKSAKYFVDSNKGVVCRHSLDGITPLSIVYKTNSFFVSKLEAFKNTLNQTIPSTGTPTVYGVYDAYTNKYILKLDAISREDFTQEAYTISFLEGMGNNKGFESFLSFHPENMASLNNTFVSFNAGRVWTHNSNLYCNFFNTQYGASIQIVFNDAALDKKTFLSIMQTANTIWSCPTIISQSNSYSTTNQETQIVASRFKYLEGQYAAAIPRDINSRGGLLNGGSMKGGYLIVTFQKDLASQFAYINTASVKYIASPLNMR